MQFSRANLQQDDTTMLDFKIDYHLHCSLFTQRNNMGGVPLKNNVGKTAH